METAITETVTLVRRSILRCAAPTRVMTAVVFLIVNVEIKALTSE